MADYGYKSGGLTSPSYSAPTAESTYKTANDFGADYGMFGRLGNDLFGFNDHAEQEADAYNTALSNAFNAAEAKKARDFESAEAKKNRDWQEMMSSTAYQRMVKDAKAAGINPLYIVGQGGASTPSGATATAHAATGSSASSNNAKDTQRNKNSNMATTALTIAKLFAILAA